MQYVTTDNASFSCTTGAGLFIARATFSRSCPECGTTEKVYREGFPITMVSQSFRHIQVRCSNCGLEYFSRITCSLDLSDIRTDRGFGFADHLARTWGLAIGALQHYKGATR